MIAGAGIEEAALVICPDLDITEIAQLKGRRIALPAKGGMKDLTFKGLLKAHNVKREDVYAIHHPSGDAALLSFISKNADAVVTVEPFATLLVELGFGKVLARTKDIWPGVPGCSPTTTDNYVAERREVVVRVIRAFLKAEEFCYNYRAEAAQLSADYIGISPQIIEKALNYNYPRIDVSDKVGSMLEVANLMIELGYVETISKDFYNFELLKEAKRQGKSS
jgi:NitT/TauT family transport system substrate-binding protein